MKTNSSKNKVIIIVILLVLLGVTGFISLKALHTKQATKTAETTNLNPDQTQPVISDEDETTGRNQANDTSTDLPTPILYKSSGNNGPVPTGAVIEFICRSQVGLKCNVVLAEQNSNQIIDLGEKTIQEGRGQSGASWEWTSQKGSWKVVAKTTNNTGASKQSASQTLTVQ